MSMPPQQMPTGSRGVPQVRVESTTLGLRTADVMARDVKTCSLESTCQQAARMMRDYDVGVLPVVDGDKVVGMVTDRDIAIRHVASGDSDPGHSTVRECMSRNVISVEPNAHLGKALQVMQENRVRRLVVMEGEELRGILSLDDLLVHASRAERAGQALERSMERME